MDNTQTLEMLQRELDITNSVIANMRFFPLLFDFIEFDGDFEEWLTSLELKTLEYFLDGADTLQTCMMSLAAIMRWGTNFQGDDDTLQIFAEGFREVVASEILERINPSPTT